MQRGATGLRHLGLPSPQHPHKVRIFMITKDLGVAEK
jgi:hypothetical protein